MVIYALLIWQITIPSFFGWLPTTVLTVALIILTVLNSRQVRWKGAAEALEVELTTVRERCERLDDANKRLLGENGELRAKVDLTPIKQELLAVHKTITDQYQNTTRALTEMTKVLITLEQKISAGNKNV